jgi:hypothetical protein
MVVLPARKNKVALPPLPVAVRAEHTRIVRLLALLAIFLVSSEEWIVALDPTNHISQYGHTAWRTKDGVFAGESRRVAQTTDGYLAGNDGWTLAF